MTEPAISEEMVEHFRKALIQCNCTSRDGTVVTDSMERVLACFTAALSDQVVAASGWRTDLENAPRDTAVWILLDGHPYLGFCESANWLCERDQWFAKSTFVRRGSSMDRRATPTTDDIYCCHGIDVKPTAWQPLPAPPPACPAGEVEP